jgi:hypothetical protein
MCESQAVLVFLNGANHGYNVDVIQSDRIRQPKILGWQGETGGAGVQRYGEWYFQDWKEERRIGPNGKEKRVYTYVGDHYDLPEHGRVFKAIHSGIFLVFLAGLLYLNGFPSPGGMSRQVGPLCLLSVAPAIYWAIGWLCLLPAAPQMTYRRYRRSIVRMRGASGVGMAVLAVAMIFELRFMILNEVTAAELRYCLVLCLTLAAAGWAAVWLLLKFPIRMVDRAGN